MKTHDETETEVARAEQRGAMLRVFGGTALAFMALLLVAPLVRPDLMKAAMSMVMSAMP